MLKAAALAFPLRYKIPFRQRLAVLAALLLRNFPARLIWLPERVPAEAVPVPALVKRAVVRVSRLVLSIY